MNAAVWSLQEFQELDDNVAEPILFHGTANCFSTLLETKGWPLDRRPFKWTDVDFVSDMAGRLNITRGEWIGIGVSRNQAGASFTGQFSRAVRYAEQCPGGENLFSAIDVAARLITHCQQTAGTHTELPRLQNLHAQWRRLIENASPVVYAVRSTRLAFPNFFASRDAEVQFHGAVRSRPMECNPVLDVPVASIIGRVDLARPLTWT